MTAIHDRLPIHRHDDPARREPGARTAQASEPARAVERTLPRFAQSIPPNADFQALVDEFKLELVYRALAQSGGNHRRAAALIGVHRSSFTRMLHRLEATRNTRQATRPERSPHAAFAPGCGT